MAKFPLSIFSFNTLAIKTVPKSWLLSLLLLSFVLICSEFVARLTLLPLGDQVWAYWSQSAASRFEWYRQQAERGEVPEVLIIGDSSGARNIEPSTFTQSSGVLAFNLSWPGNFPLALKVNTFPLLKSLPPPKYVLLSQSPWSYIENERVSRNELGIVTSVLARRLKGEFIMADHFYLSRLYQARHYLVKYWLKQAPLVTQPKNFGFLPLLPEQVNKKDEEILTCATNEAFSLKRRSTLVELINIAREKKFKLIILIQPLLDCADTKMFKIHFAWLEKLVKQNQDVTELWDYSIDTRLRNDEFMDEMHMWPHGATHFSKILAEDFKKKFRHDLPELE